MKQQRNSRSAALGLMVTMLALDVAVAQEPVTVIVGQPRATAARTVELPGSFEPYEDAFLYAKITGYVAKVQVDIGDRVSAGAALVRLEIPEMEPALGRAQADVLAAKAASEQVAAQISRDSITYERLSQLKAEEPLAVTQQDVDMAAADLQVSEAAARSAEAEISVAKAKLGELEAMMAYAVIRAPFDGVVVQRLVDPGALVVAGSDGGTPVLEVAREDRLRLVLAVPESLVAQTNPGLPTKITVDALPGRIFEAEVSRCAGQLSQDTRTMRAEIDMDHKGGLLRPGMYATVALQLGSGPGSLSVPASLVHREAEGQSFVWTVENGTAVKTRVEIVRDDGASAVIQTGLDAGSSIVLEGPADLEEGQPVRVAATAGDR